MIQIIKRFLLAALLLFPVLAAAVFEPGESTTVIKADGLDITVYVYKPSRYAREGLIVSLHGTTRNAADYRTYTRSLADRYRGLLIAPYFDQARFPTWRYSYGGISRARGEGKSREFMPSSQWTSELLRSIIDQVRAMEDAPDMPYVLIGHSAGAQFLSRVAAFSNLRPQRFILANPGTWVAPSMEAAFPYGFGDLPASVSGPGAIEHYLAQPLTVLIGTSDSKVDKHLPLTKGALAQGETRYPRALTVFRQAQETARAQGWRLGWTLIEVPQVGHIARSMYKSQYAVNAFCPEKSLSGVQSPQFEKSVWPCDSVDSTGNAKGSEAPSGTAGFGARALSRAAPPRAAGSTTG